MSLGTNISRLRAEKHFSQGDLAEALDVSRQSVSKWETDASVPDLDKLLKLSQLFGVSLDELVTGAPAEQAPLTEPGATAPAVEIAAPAFPLRKVVGIVLLCMGFLAALVLAVMGGLQEGLLLALPFVLCGVVCLTVRRWPGLWCGWALYLPAGLYLNLATGISWSLIFLTPHFTPEMNYMRLAIAWVEVLLTVLLVGWTVFRYRKPKGPFSPKQRRLLAAGWVGWLLLYLTGGRWVYALFTHVSLVVAATLFNDLLLILLAVLVAATVRAVRARKLAWPPVKDA